MNNRIISPNFFLILIAIVIIFTLAGCEQINKVLYKDAGTETGKESNTNSDINAAIRIHYIL